MGRCYPHLNLDEHRILATMLQAKAAKTKFAEVLGRDRSTIFRELKRNHFRDVSMPKHDGYYSAAAQLMTADRRVRDRKLIKDGWTPEQIGNRMIQERAKLRVIC